ncbi:putative isoprenylcysteine alpha-carbonyl methylesterase icmel2 [Orobanche gracilis]
MRNPTNISSLSNLEIFANPNKAHLPFPFLQIDFTLALLTTMETSSSLPANLLSRDSINEITEETETDTLVRVSSFPVNQQPRRRVGNKSAPYAARTRRPQSLGCEIGHAAAETYLLTRLSFQLLSYLGVGYRWIIRLLALALYAMLLMPGFLQVAFSYFFSNQVRRSIVYGDQPRNRLDLYLPTNNDDLKPVVIFVTGGAWIIGGVSDTEIIWYKAWGSFLGLQLAERNIIVACLDYRSDQWINFPQGTISDMVNDVCQGIEFVCNNIIEFGGDPNRWQGSLICNWIYLMGQSAGAHISSCALFQQAIKESRNDSISWSVSQINAYFGLSGEKFPKIGPERHTGRVSGDTARVWKSEVTLDRALDPCLEIWSDTRPDTRPGTR